MRAANRESAPPDDRPGDADVVDLDASTGDAHPTDRVAGRGAEELLTGGLRARLGTVAGFLTLLHLVFAVVKLTAPASGPATTSDAPTWSLLLRLAVAGVVFALLRSPLRFSRRGLRGLEALLFGFEMVVLLAAQYLSAIDLIDRRDLVDAVAVQKNGVLRAIMLMLCYGIFVPRAPATTARIVVTMATALIVCHGIVLHHADTLQLDRDDLANHQIVMSNALFLIMGAVLATLAGWRLRGGAAHGDGTAGVGPYRLLRKLDGGGMGDVYLAEHDRLGRPCALKLLRQRGPDAGARFESEVQAGARISHPNVVTIFDAGRTDDGIPFCAMEYVPGLCIADVVTGSGPMPPSRAAFIGRQLCAALAEIHRLGFVHRDLNPANVLLSCLPGQRDTAKLLDLGAVGGEAAGPDRDPGSIGGTPEYVAPEQAMAGSPVDGRADLYGLGALLHFMVSGVPPHVRPTPAEVLRAHVSAPVGPLRERAADLPADLEAVILRCLSKSPDDRYPDARAVADALGSCACAHGWDEARADRWWSERRTQGPAPGTVTA